MITISEMISKLIPFNKTERPVFVKIYTRNTFGDVIGSRRYPVKAVFSHADDCAEIMIEESQAQDIRFDEEEDIPEIFPDTMKKLDEILDIKTK